MNAPGSLLGLSGYLNREEIDSLVRSLSTIWELSMRKEPGELERDLASCRRWFDPVAQGHRLRRELVNVPPVPEHIHDPGEPLTLPVGEGQSLVTPEGRCALDLLRSLTGDRGDRKGNMIADAQLVQYDRLLAHLYREWSRHRIRSVVDLLAGEDKPLQIAAAGVVIALLVNRSTSPSRALKRFPAGSARDVIDQAFFKAVQTFTRTLSPKQRPTQDPQLISGWMLYEARRRLGNDVMVIEDARPDTEGRLWIDESKENEVIGVVTRDLSRGHRVRVTVESLTRAFDSLVSALRSEAGRLAGFGLAHERPANTDRIRQALLVGFRQQHDVL